VNFDSAKEKSANEEFTEGQERMGFHSTLENIEVTTNKSPLSAIVYTIMLDEEIGVNKSEEVREEWLLETYREGFDFNR
jgi:hypothetical protein